MLEKAANIWEQGLTAIAKDASKEKSKIYAIFKRIARYPFKILAAYIAAPVLVFKIACTVTNPIRRIIAIIGLLLALILSYSAATFLGTLVGAAFIASTIGILFGVGFLLGGTVSIYLSVIFAIIVLNTVCWFFLNMSSQEVADYLHALST